MTEYEQVTTVTARNGEKEIIPTQVQDNRIHLEVDAKKLEAWELTVLESVVVGDWLLLYARYAANGRGLISPNLPRNPIDELTPEELKEIKDSKAYKAVKRFSMTALKGAADAFTEQLRAGF